MTELLCFGGDDVWRVVEVGKGGEVRRLGLLLVARWSGIELVHDAWVAPIVSISFQDYAIST